MSNFQIPKILTQSDITRKIFLPTRILKHFPIPQGTHFVDLWVIDPTEQMWWPLRLYTRPTGKRACPVFTVGWRYFVRDKGLKVDDKLIFSRHRVRATDGELQMQYTIQVARKSEVSYQGEPVYLDDDGQLSLIF
ncbi:hypothetical protein EZV62_006418 [Acer yangbiense]|uniref:TF-B3 domain-containing protein n=1 Tax=Acer yangbiense TaxID=1000413 RepID=A0A5C7I6H4_9ROSI|nr:hypothetical protein EZV62_006418 [Acer yangbiense]